MDVSTRDPVCRVTVDLSSPLQVEYRGRLYLFCSEKCRDHFCQDPEGALTDRDTPDFLRPDSLPPVREWA